MLHPGGPALNCARHPNVETALTCNHCGTPICPRCAVLTPVGYKCRDCAKPARTVGDVSVGLAVRTAVVTLLTASLGGLLLVVIPFFFLAALGYGWVVGEVAFASSRRRSGPVVEAIAGVSVIVGMLAPSLLFGLSHAGLSAADWVELLHLTSPFYLVMMGLAAVMSVSRVRYR